MRVKLIIMLIISSVLLLMGCDQMGNPHQNNTKKSVEKAEISKGKINQKQSEAVSNKKAKPLDKLRGDFREIAKIASEYELPTEGRVKKGSPFYETQQRQPQDIVYNNGYGFFEQGALDIITVLPGHQKQQPTKGQYLGVIMGTVADMTDDLGDPKNLILGDTSHMTQEDWNKEETEAFKFNEGDIENKLKRFEEMKHYTDKYPLIKKKLDEAEATFKEAQTKGRSPQTIQEAVALYKKGVTQIKALDKAFTVGQSIKLKEMYP